MEPLLTILIWAVVFIAGFGIYKGYERYDAKVLEPRRRFAELDAVAQKVASHNLQYMLSAGESEKRKQLPKGNSNTQKASDKNETPSESHKEVILRKGFDVGKFLQESFGTIRELPPYLPLSDVLIEDHPVNTEIKSAFKAHREEPFHTGPFAHQLSDEEWSYVQDAYRDALQARLNARIRAESHVRAVDGFETEVRRELKEYVKARRELNGGEHDHDPFAEEFEQLMNSEENEKD